MATKFFLCIWIVLASVSSGSSTEGDESSLRKYSKRATYVAAAVGAIYTAQQLINDAMGNSEIPMDTPGKRALSYSQAVFASFVLDETLKWAYASGYQALERIGRYKFGNKTRRVILVQEDSKKTPPLKRVPLKEEWVHRMSSRTSIGIGFFDSLVTAYFLCKQMSHLCTEPFDALSAFGFLEAFCMGAVVVGNAKCLIFSEKFDEKLPWRQFSEGMRKSAICPYLADWKIGLYNSSLVEKKIITLWQSRPNDLDILVKTVFQPTATLRGVEFLHGAFVWSFAKDVFLGAGKIFHNALEGWQLWTTDAQIYQKSNVFLPKPSNSERTNGVTRAIARIF